MDLSFVAGALTGIDTVVLVEGVSDVAALEALGIARSGLLILPLGGATNVGTVARRFADSPVHVVGLCDIGEERFFAKVLDEYFVCDADLEDELIRSLGIEGTERVIELQGDLGMLRTFQNQPAQRSRAPQQQLRRFMGTLAGRKEKYGRALVEGLGDGPVPAPLAALRERVARP